MPPKSRKRVKVTTEPDLGSSPGAEPEVVSSDTTYTLPENVLAASGSKGFSSLPRELLLRVVEQFPEILPRVVRYTRTSVPGSFKLRFQVLRALSQTCRQLRRFYLPLLWEHFEVCIASSDEVSWYRNLGDAMERKSKGLLASKHLWPYVRVVTVVFTRYKTETVLPPFVKLLQSLPNVHTFQVSHAHAAMTTALKEAFKGSCFPNIRTVTIPTCAHEVLRCCPGVREITSNCDDGQKLVSALITAGCSKLEVINYCSPGPTILKRLVKANPPLRYVRVDGDEDEIRSFSVFPSLRVIEIAYNGSKPSAESTRLVQVAKEVLQGCNNITPITKAQRAGRGGKGGSKNVQDVSKNSSDLPSGPQIVKVRYLAVQMGLSDGITVEEFPV